MRLFHFIAAMLVAAIAGYGLAIVISIRRRSAVTSAITDLERLNEVLSAGIADRVRVREIVEKLRKAVE